MLIIEVNFELLAGAKAILVLTGSMSCQPLFRLESDREQH